MSGSTDSHQMVCSLSVSQEFVKYNMFLTFTCGQKDFPGTRNLFQWKSSKEWLSSITNYSSMSNFEHTEFAKSIEDLYGLISFRNWMESRQSLLNFYSTTYHLMVHVHVCSLGLNTKKLLVTFHTSTPYLP